MFFDWLESLVTPCPRHLRAMGYLRELLGIKARRQRCWWSWEPHLERSQALLRTAMARCPQRRKAVILGSGLLNDVPLEELAKTFGEVVLVDLLHSVGTRRQRRRFANVRLLTADVTGTIEAVYRVADQKGASLPRAVPQLFCDDLTVDLVASVNILSQLPFLPAAYLRRFGAHEEEGIVRFAQDVIRAHLDYLQRLPGTVALISDVECLTLNRGGTVIERTSSLYGVEFPWAGAEWIWHLAPRLELDPDHSYHRRVIGIVDVKQARPCS